MAGETDGAMVQQEPFGSAEKARVRQQCLALVGDLAARVRRELKYFGLPSPWMGDIAAWREYLGEIVAVEMERRFIPPLVTRACNLGLGHRLTYFVGDIDTLLDGAEDEYGHLLSNIFPVDLVNLDYCGGLLYERFERIAALAELLRYQARGLRDLPRKSHPYFLLFITHNSAPWSGKQREFAHYLDRLAEDAAHYAEPLKGQLAENVRWYKSKDCPPEYRHKTFVIGKLMEFAQPLGFSVYIEHAIAYRGDNNTPMMHYSLRIVPEALGEVVSATTRLDVPLILNTPVLNVDGDNIDVPTQRPQIDIAGRAREGRRHRKR